MSRTQRVERMNLYKLIKMRNVSNIIYLQDIILMENVGG
uniref:Uncharacterized protein n=1 Tax=Medicago truncatula TaxID=3880 RepID=I3SA16_MEDTR|nr:unknown [Medicago truncatula]